MRPECEVVENRAQGSRGCGCRHEKARELVARQRVALRRRTKRLEDDRVVVAERVERIGQHRWRGLAKRVEEVATAALGATRRRVRSLGRGHHSMRADEWRERAGIL